MRVRVHEQPLVAHDPDVVAPKHEIAAPQAFAEVNGNPKRPLLHVAVAQRRNACTLKRSLHKTGAVDPVCRAPAPAVTGSICASGTNPPPASSANFDPAARTASFAPIGKTNSAAAFTSAAA
jgi:hypothetical protein